jgi:hypothetical protein
VKPGGLDQSVAAEVDQSQTGANIQAERVLLDRVRRLGKDQRQKRSYRA